MANHHEKIIKFLPSSTLQKIRTAEASQPRVSPGFDPKCLETNLKESVTEEQFAASISSTPNLKSAKIKSENAPEPNVRVRVRRAVVQVRVERASVRAIVPVAAADNGAGRGPKIFEIKPKIIHIVFKLSDK